MLSRSLDSREVVRAAEDRLRPRFVTGVSCEYCDGVLYLRGRSNSFYQKQMAQEVVRRMEGVAAVVNQIEVVAKRW
jgi:osmotically-inducible protein OsmY